MLFCQYKASFRWWAELRASSLGFGPVPLTGLVNAMHLANLNSGWECWCLVSLGRAYCSYGISKLELNYHVPIQSQAFCLPFFVKETNQACGGILVGLVTKCLSIHQRFILGMWNNDSSKVLDNLFPRFVDFFLPPRYSDAVKKGFALVAGIVCLTALKIKRIQMLWMRDVVKC